MRNKLLAVIGALLVGALGSGLWELLKPLFLWASSASLNIVTLGLDSLRDGLYADAAAQEPERISATLLAILTGVATGVMLVVMFFPQGSIFKKPSAPNTEDPEQLAAYHQSLLGHLSTLKKIKLSLVIVLAVVLTFQFLMTQRVIYVSRATAHFNRLCLIAAPYMSEGELTRIRSIFSQTSTRDEYVSVIRKLQGLIEQNGARAPSFSIY